MVSGSAWSMMTSSIHFRDEWERARFSGRGPARWRRSRGQSGAICLCVALSSSPLILACIVYWQARELSRLAAASDFPFDIDLISHISPIEWKNVILYGEIKIDPAKLRIRSP